MSSVGHYGPKPWLQTSWDAHAAWNFIGGGMGGGLLVFTVLSGARGLAFSLLVVAALSLVALGLISVALELGRPRRAWRVLANPGTSWMSREAWTALLLFPVGLAAALGVSSLAWLAAILAVGFIFCQARTVQAARGIPAWREPLVLPLLVTSSLVEGAGLLLATAAFHHAATMTIVGLFGGLVVARFGLWIAYRRRIAREATREACAALYGAGRVLALAGTLVPLALAGLAALAAGYALPLVALAGLSAAASGVALKLAIVTRAAFNQGFSVTRMPVRGVRR